MSSRVVQWRGRSSCRGDAEAGSAGLSATSRHWLARSARKRRGTTSGRRAERGLSQAWIVAANNSLVSLTPRFDFGFRLNGVTIRLFKLSRPAVLTTALGACRQDDASVSNFFFGSQSWEQADTGCCMSTRVLPLHLRVHVLPIVLAARCTHLSHATLPRISLTRLSHAPLPRASPTRLFHAPSTRLSHVPRSGGAGQAAQLQ